MRILVVPNEQPLPANRGGRIDVWRRLQLLKGMGAQVALLSWYDEPRDGPPTPAVMAELLGVCDRVHLSAIRRSPAEMLRRLAWVGRWPSHVASRWVTLQRADALGFARQFAPDLLLLDGLYGVAVVQWLSARLGVPWVYRSHNIEHLYMQRQHRSATAWRERLAISANLLGLKRLECAVLRQARLVFDISLADQAFWQAQGSQQVVWLPSVVDAGFAQDMQTVSALPPDCDVVYFGNLNSPNNVTAVRWLVRQVMPALGDRPCSVVLAGSRPSAELRVLVASDRRLTLRADPPSIPAIAGAARVLVNPVQAGSGVNLKSVEMLFSAAHLISTPAGVQGLPAQAVACFTLASAAAEFAQAIAAALDAGPPSAAQLAQRHTARAAFEPAHAARVLQQALEPVLRGARA